MASRVVKPKNYDYGIIQRGCSFLIPVKIKDEYDDPLDLTGYKGAFTVKRYKRDFDRHDDFAFIAKDFEIQNPTQGSFFVALTSDDTDFDPGEYYFDIELIHPENGMIWRVVTMKFELDGGPTNRHINPGLGQLPTGETVTVITLSEGNPIVVIAPTLSLDAEIYAQMATILEEVAALRDKVDSYEELTTQQAQTIASLQDEVADIKEALGL